jgi:hypothetical protein
MDYAFAMGGICCWWKRFNAIGLMQDLHICWKERKNVGPKVGYFTQACWALKS